MDPPPRKRRRAALSCLDCKRRKLKCDRTYPCSRCQKRGHPQTCTYENALLGPGESLVDGFPKILANSTCAPGDLPEPMPRPGHTDGSHNTSNTSASDPGALHEAASRSAHIESSGGLSFTVQAQADRILQLENRVIGLEGIMVRHPTGPAGAQGWDRKLLAHQSALDPSVLSTSSTLYQEVAWKEPVDLGLMHLRGKNFKTQFYGASHPTSLITQSSELGLFIKESFIRYPALGRVRSELQRTKKRKKAGRLPVAMDNASLFALLPGRESVNELVQLYLDTYERTYRILHVPSFWKEYNHFWKAPGEGNPTFVVLLILVMAVVRCLRIETPRVFIGESSQEREVAITWVETADTWIEAQSQKRTTLAFFQVHCLSFLAKETNEIKKKRRWMSAGTLLRRGLGAGLHREAGPLDHKTPVFMREMRRRIWGTIAELELQASVSRGMPSTLTGMLCNCDAPVNINDKDLEESAGELALSRPASEYTDTSFQIASRQSLPLRLELTSFINGPDPSLSYEQLLDYDSRIMQAIQAIPSWVPQEATERNAPASSFLPRVLLELQLRQYLFWLHRPFAQRGQQEPKYGYSRIVYLDNAILVLRQHLNVAASNNPALSILRNDDILQATLSLCHDLCMSAPISGGGTPHTQILAKQAFQVATKSLGLLEENVLLLGQGYKSFYFLSLTLAWARKKLSPELLDNENVDWPERCVSLFHTMMASQPPVSVAATGDKVAGMLAFEPVSRDGYTDQDPLDQSYVLPGSFETPMLTTDGFDYSAIPDLDLEYFWNF